MGKITIGSNKVPIESLKIGVVIPYLGKWPKYFNIFLKGCEYNEWLDIIFFTDCPIPKVRLQNVIFHSFSLEQISLLASEKIGLDLKVATPYKLCDFKPCYGLIFEDYLKDYDYWGYGDIDLIYGNLKPFIIDRIKEGYDILSSREEILTGSFCLFRNTNFINNIFSESPNYKQLLSLEKTVSFAETCYSSITWHGKSKLALPKSSFTYVVAKNHASKNISASFTNICKEKIGKKEIVHYRDGALVFNDQSLGYYHFVCNKGDLKYIFPDWKSIPSHFFITNTGFYKTNRKVVYHLVHGFRQSIGLIKSYYKKVASRIYRS